jgi:hypothetical protein
MRKKIVTLVAAVPLAAVVGTAAYAAIPDAGGVIHSCIGKAGALRVIDTDAGQTCAKGEQALTWSQSGPEGPAGSPGAPGISGYEVVSRSTVLEQLGDIWYAQLFLPCPAGKKILGGGAEVNSTTARLFRSAPAGDGDGWIAGAVQTDGAGQLNLYAICGYVT